MKRQRLLLMLFAFTVLLFCYYASSYAFPIPDTGQTTCYDSSGNATSCAGTGQDGAYIINPMSYTDNGDGTVTDNVTGLMWQKQGDGTQRTWSTAGTYCTNLSIGGHSDWRLPAIMELLSIVDYGVHPGPTINATFFPNTYADWYWSSTTYADDTTTMWDVGFDGGEYYNDNTATINDYVRCVRGGQNSASFIDNGNGTVTDSGSGLMWQKEEGSSRTWTDALSYCNGLSLGGFSDWRLPNIKELASLVDFTSYSPAINTTFFPNAQSDLYLSSTTTAFATNSPQDVSFFDGLFDGVNPKSQNENVRCVRGGQSGSIGSNYALSVSEAGTGSGTVTANSGTISWSGSTGTASYSRGTSVTLTATANSGSTFTSWSGCDSTSGNSCTVAMTTTKSVAATFGSCTYTISPTSQSVNSSGGTGSVSVTTASGCTWTTSSSLSWVTITSGSSGTGNGTVSYRVSANTGTSLQTGNITIAGQTFSVMQAGQTSGSTIQVVSASGASSRTIQSAYNTAAVNGGGIIEVQAGTYPEALSFSKNVSVYLIGGYNSNFSTAQAITISNNSLNSAITGSTGQLTISNGTVTVQNIIIQ